MEEEIRERRAPPLSLHHPGALIMDTMETTTLTRPHVLLGPCVCVGQENGPSVELNNINHTEFST